MDTRRSLHHRPGTLAILGCVVLLWLLSSASQAAAERRVALVIGNGAYTDTRALPNPPNDARDVAAKLSELGFDVVAGYDLDSDQISDARRRFFDKVRGADVALLYYAGHGVQVDGINYILPVDAKILEKTDLNRWAVDVNDLIDDMKAAQLSIIILDACRDNPLTRSLSRSASTSAGLAPVEVGTGSYIAFSTAPGHTAADGTGRNSPFTAALLRHIDEPDVEIRLMMADVRGDVWTSTDQTQRPWENNSLIGKFFFKRSDAADLEERAAFLAALRDGKAQTLEAFLAKYPDGKFAGAAQQALVVVQGGSPALSIDELFWTTIRESVLPAEFELYLQLFPDGAERDLAGARLDALRHAGEIAGAVIDGRPLDSASAIRQAALDRAEGLPLKFVQYGLIALGYTITDPAGVLDAETSRAMRAYQAAVDAPQTGVLTPWQIMDVVLNAAVVGDDHAETAVGVMNASGLGFEQNDTVARLWLRRAADKGNGYAMANLAILYRDGRGGPPDIGSARMLLEKAISEGVTEAAPLLDSLGG